MINLNQASSKKVHIQKYKAISELLENNIRSSLSFEEKFTDSINRLVVAFKAVYLEPESSTSLKVPTLLYKAIDLDNILASENTQDWLKAISRELQALKSINTFKILYRALPEGRKLISSRWILRRKFNTALRVACRKARLVIREYKQQAEIDYFETFASILQYATFRILYTKTAADNLEIDHININIAFLNLDLKEEIYIKLLQFILEVFLELENKHIYIQLNKAFYSLKQAFKE